MRPARITVVAGAVRLVGLAVSFAVALLFWRHWPETGMSGRGCSRLADLLGQNCHAPPHHGGPYAHGPGMVGRLLVATAHQVAPARDHSQATLFTKSSKQRPCPCPTESSKQWPRPASGTTRAVPEAGDCAHRTAALRRLVVPRPSHQPQRHDRAARWHTKGKLWCPFSRPKGFWTAAGVFNGM